MQGVPNFRILRVLVCKTCYSKYVELSTITSSRHLYNSKFYNTYILSYCTNKKRLWCRITKQKNVSFYLRYGFNWDRDSSVGIAIRYSLDGPGIESRWGRDFPHSSRPALVPTQTPI